MDPNNPLDLESVRCFLAAARERSFRAAAELVHLSPAAFGERIKRLEEDLGAPLFERTTRTMHLTEAGERFVGPAERLFEHERIAREAARDPEQTPPFELVIGTRFELGMSWLVPSLPELQKERPERFIHYYFGESTDLLRNVLEQNIDAVVSSFRVSQVGLAYAPLHDEDYVFVGAKKYLAKHPLKSAADAPNHVLIDTQSDLPLWRYFLDAVPAEPGWAFERIERMGTIAAVRHRVLAGAGVAVLPRYFVEPDLKAKRLVRVMPKVDPRQDVFRLIWRADHVRDRELRRLAATLKTFPLK
ncbi:MAG: LysR family transcriptional regulator [Deltaproteobacteria bacterium]